LVQQLLLYVQQLLYISSLFFGTKAFLLVKTLGMLIAINKNEHV